MGKLTTYIIVMSGLMLLFYFSGLLDNSVDSAFLDLLLNPDGMADSEPATQAILVFEGITAIGIIAIGFFTGNLELAVVGVFALYLFNLLWDFLFVFAKVYSANPVIATLFFAPLLFLYIVTVVEWWRGRDT